jgi:hypothetical protein
MKNSVVMKSINTLYFRQNNSLIFKLTSNQRKKKIMKSLFNLMVPLNINGGLILIMKSALSSWILKGHLTT